MTPRKSTGTGPRRRCDPARAGGVVRAGESIRLPDPAKLAEMAQRADTLSRGAKTDECADAAANAASAVVVALKIRPAPRGCRTRAVA